MPFSATEPQSSSLFLLLLKRLKKLVQPGILLPLKANHQIVDLPNTHISIPITHPRGIKGGV